MKYRVLFIFAVLSSLVLLSGCGDSSLTSDSNDQEKRITITGTLPGEGDVVLLSKLFSANYYLGNWVNVCDFFTKRYQEEIVKNTSLVAEKNPKKYPGFPDDPDCVSIFEWLDESGQSDRDFYADIDTSSSSSAVVYKGTVNGRRITILSDGATENEIRWARENRILRIDEIVSSG